MDELRSDGDCKTLQYHIYLFTRKSPLTEHFGKKTPAQVVKTKNIQYAHTYIRPHIYTKCIIQHLTRGQGHVWNHGQSEDTRHVLCVFFNSVAIRVECCSVAASPVVFRVDPLTVDREAEGL